MLGGSSLATATAPLNSFRHLRDHTVVPTAHHGMHWLSSLAQSVMTPAQTHAVR